MSQLNENEMSSAQTSTSLNHSAEATQVVSDTTNYTTDKLHCQINKMSIPSFYENGNFLHHKLCSFVIKQFKVQRLNGTNHIYRDGIYKYDDELIEYAITGVSRKSKPAEVKLVMDYMRIITKMSVASEDSSEYVGFNNGVLNLDNLDFTEFQPFPTDYILTNKLGIDFVDPITVADSANVELIDKFFKEVSNGNLELEELLYQIIGASCVRGNIEPLAFILSGNSDTKGKDGRDIYVNIINSILGDCVAHEELLDIALGKSASKMYTKTCNISHEQEEPKVPNMNAVRHIIRGKTITDSKSGLEFNPFVTMIFNIPDLVNLDKCFLGLNGYFKIIPFNETLSFDRSMVKTLLKTENLQYIAFKALHTYCNGLENGQYTIPDIVENETNQYLLDNNSAREFIESNPIFHIIRKDVYYKQYSGWCSENNKRCVANSVFGPQVLKKYVKDRISNGTGKKPCYYREKEFNVTKLREQYLDLLMSKTMYTEIANDRSADGKFVAAFADYFANHSIDEESDVDALTDRTNEEIAKAIEDLPNVVLSSKEPQ